MGFFDDLAMGTGLKDRDDDYYERTAQTLGRESQGGSAQREAQYRGSMGLNGGATIANQGLSKDGLLGMAASGLRDAIGGKGGGKVENPAQVAQSPMRPQMRDISQMPPQMRPNPYGDHSTNYGGGGGTVVPLSDLTGAPTYSPREWYDYPTEFPLGAEPESLLSLERPIRPYAGRDNFMEFSQPSDRAIQRDMPAYPAQVDGVVGTDTMMGRQVNPIRPVDAAEFQRFRSQYEDILKRNGQWGFPDREADAFQALKSGGQNY